MPETNHVGQPYYTLVDGTTWPMANAAIGEVEWMLRHSKPTRSDLLIAAGVLAAYRELVHYSRANREAVVRRLMEAERLYPCETKED